MLINLYFLSLYIAFPLCKTIRTKFIQEYYLLIQGRSAQALVSYFFFHTTNNKIISGIEFFFMKQAPVT